MAVLRLISLLTVIAVAHVAAADPPTGYKCGPGARVVKDVGCACPKDKVDARDPSGKAICAPKPPPPATACLVERKGKLAVKIDSTPNGAAVYLGAKTCGSVGTTPWTGKLVAGPVTVILERQGYEPVTRDFTVAAKGKQELAISLVRTNVGTIDVRADADKNVTGATITVDGERKGTVPAAFPATGGRRRVEITQTGYEPFAQWVDVIDSQTVLVMPVLVPAVVAKGKLVIEADVDAAEVWIDGTRRGVTTLVVDDLPVKTYDVEVKKPGATPWKQKVTITKGQNLVRATLAATMPKAPTHGMLSIKCQPAAEVVIDGNVAGMTPYEAKLPAGDYWIQLRAAGYRTYDKRHALAADATVALDEKLAKTGQIAITSTPAGATIYVDGARLGITPMTIDATLGEHKIIVERAGYQRYTQTVKVTDGKKQIEVTLKP